MALITNKPYTTDASQTINPVMLGDQSNQDSGRLIYLRVRCVKMAIFSRYQQYENDDHLQDVTAEYFVYLYMSTPN